MPKPEQHTIFRFSLRSLLAITSGVALVMTVASPWLRVLDDFQWWHLRAVLAVVTTGMASSLLYFILTRRNIGMQCGKLLLTLQERPPRNLMQFEWGMLLFGLVYAIVYLFFVGDPTNRDDIGIVFVPTVTLPFLFWWSTRLAKHGLALWAEGFGQTVEFCENGLVIGNRLHKWDSPTLRDIHWTMPGDGIVLSINRHFLTVPVAPQTVPVPPQQCEGVEAILEHYYRPYHRTAQ